MVKKWDPIYELRTDEPRFRRMQDETAQLRTTLEAGSIERRTIEGTITEARPTSLPDPQQFRMLTTDGSELIGVRHGDPSRYVEGLHLRFEYVTLERSAAASSQSDSTADIVTAVWIEHSHRRTPYVHSVLPPFPWPIDFDR